MSLATRLADVLTLEEQAVLSALHRKAARAAKLGAVEQSWIVPAEAFSDAAKIYAESARIIERLAELAADHRGDLI